MYISTDGYNLHVLCIYIKLLMDIPSMYYVFIFNYISTDGYTLHVLCIYIQLY